MSIFNQDLFRSQTYSDGRKHLKDNSVHFKVIVHTRNMGVEMSVISSKYNSIGELSVLETSLVVLELL